MDNQNTNDSLFKFPLTEKSYLLWASCGEVDTEVMTGDGKLVYQLEIISGILKLYGAHISHIHSGYPKSDVENRHERKYNTSPFICFIYKDFPLYQRQGQIELMKNILQEKGLDTWYNYRKMNEEKKEILKIYKDRRESLQQSGEYKIWESRQLTLIKIVKFWIVNFLNKYNMPKDYELKLEDYYESTLYDLMVVKLTETDGKNVQKIEEENQIKLSILQDFAKYLFDGFVSGDKNFPKSIYESTKI